MKRPDNLHPEGQFANRPQEEWAPGERAPVVKRADNLKPEGEFAKSQPQEWHKAVPNPAFKYEDNLRPEGQLASRPQEEWAPGERAPLLSNVLTTSDQKVLSFMMIFL